MSPRARAVLWLLCLVLGGGAAGCASAPDPSGAFDPRSLAGSRWVAREIDGRAVLEGVQSTLAFSEHFEADGAVTGDTACNRFAGEIEITGDVVSFGPLATTRRACAPAVMDQEQRYLDALGRTRRFERTGDRLDALDGANERRIRFEAASG